MNNTPKKVFVSGCYDMLHSGHVAFFEEGAQHGDLYVGLGSGETVFDLKGRKNINTDEERLYMVQSIRFVKKAWINRGSGILDFEDELNELHPDIFFVNEDGHSPDKEKLCNELGIEYRVSKRIPHAKLPRRSTTALRQECRIPFRIDLAGGWLDQPFVSKHHSGPVITISIEPDYDFNDRAGMSTSTRKKAIELWQTDIPQGDKAKLAKTLFCYENPPGIKYVSGSQDALGIVFPGLNYLYYEKGEYWPNKIVSEHDERILKWLESNLSLLSLKPRSMGYEVLDRTEITADKAKQLSVVANKLWDAARAMDEKSFGKAMIMNFEAQIKMFPLMVNPDIIEQLDAIKNKCMGYKLSGAGGGGYLVLFGAKEISNTLKIRIRR